MEQKKIDETKQQVNGSQRDIIFKMVDELKSISQNLSTNSDVADSDNMQTTIDTAIYDVIATLMSKIISWNIVPKGEIESTFKRE